MTLYYLSALVFVILSCPLAPSKWPRKMVTSSSVLTCMVPANNPRREKNASLSQCVYIREGLCLVPVLTNHCHPEDDIAWLLPPRPGAYSCGQGGGASAWQSQHNHKVREESTKGAQDNTEQKRSPAFRWPHCPRLTLPQDLLCPALTLILSKNCW